MTDNKKTQKTVKEQQTKAQHSYHNENALEESLVRILGCDIPGSKTVYAGLTRVKGISWAISNAICLKLNIPRNKKISELTKEEILKIQDFMKNPNFLDFLKNRRFQPETGDTKHLITSDLDMARDFDIRRMKKIKSYKGIRHSFGLPVRGQRTRSHFRKNRTKTGVTSKKKAT